MLTCLACSPTDLYQYLLLFAHFHCCIMTYSCAPVSYRIAGNFREVQIFAIFATHDQNAKIRTAKFQHLNFCVKNWTRGNFRTCVLCAIISLDLMMALHRYFKPAGDVLPSPTGDLSASVSPATIKGRGPKLALNAKIKTAKISSGGETGFS